MNLKECPTFQQDSRERGPYALLQQDTGTHGNWKETSFKSLKTIFKDGVQSREISPVKQMGPSGVIHTRKLCACCSPSRHPYMPPFAEQLLSDVSKILT